MGVVKNVKMYWGFYKTYPTSSWAMSLNKFANYTACFLSIIYNFRRDLPLLPLIDRSMSGASPNMAEPLDTLPADSKEASLRQNRRNIPLPLSICATLV